MSSFERATNLSFDFDYKKVVKKKARISGFSILLRINIIT
tara:strand:- start:10173 stop:10292 length:120 start_codon:yes stop_codon:yes gene_type:complete